MVAATNALPVSAFTAGNHGFKPFTFSTTSSSITFYINKGGLEKNEEFNIKCSPDSPSIHNRNQTISGKKHTLTLKELNDNTKYNCELLIVRESKITDTQVRFNTVYTSEPVAITTGNQLTIIQHKSGIDWAKFIVSDYQLQDQELFVAECSHANDPEARKIPHGFSDTREITVYNLNWYTNYNCRVGVGQRKSKALYANSVTNWSQNQVKVSTAGKKQITPNHDLPATTPVITDWSDYTRPFPDIALNSLQGQAIAELYHRGIVGGYPDGQFRGINPVNRAEAAKMLLLARYDQIPDYRTTDQFYDVFYDRWYSNYVYMAARKDIVHGYPDGRFIPEGRVNTVEFLKMLTNTFDLPTSVQHSYQDVDRSQWFNAYVGIAQEMNLFPFRDANKLQPESTLNRYEVSLAIYQYLKYSQQPKKAATPANTSQPSA